MKIEKLNLWNTIPCTYDEKPTINVYIPDRKTSRGAVVIFAGGAYSHRAVHEGDGYARFLAENGITAFVADYRVHPHIFPCPLIDARRAVKFARYHAQRYGIDKNKIAVMGSSAGGHLAALCSTYLGDTDCEITADEIEKESFVPDAQILCYPVIRVLGRDIAHIGSGENLLGKKHAWDGEDFEPDRLVSDKTPKAFIWHTASDNGVNVINSYRYAEALRRFNIPAEMHIFPDGPHGLGLCDEVKFDAVDKKVLSHTGQWSTLLLNWLSYIGF